MNGFGGFRLLLVDQVAQVAVHVLRYERREGRHRADHGEQDAEQRLQGVVAILATAVTLETLAVHPDVPVGQMIDKADETRHDGVEPISRHLRLNEEQQRLGEREDPLIHHVG